MYFQVHKNLRNRNCSSLSEKCHSFKRPQPQILQKYVHKNTTAGQPEVSIYWAGPPASCRLLHQLKCASESFRQQKHKHDIELISASLALLYDWHCNNSTTAFLHDVQWIPQQKVLHLPSCLSFCLCTSSRLLPEDTQWTWVLGIWGQRSLTED